MENLGQIQGQGQNQERIPLARRLREISNQANVNIELEKFMSKLITIANEGKTSVFFPDLRTEIPTVIQSGKYIEWFKGEELNLQGIIKQDTGAYEYTVSW